MKEFHPQKVFVQYRDCMQPTGSVEGRKYTITHSDATADLFVTIADCYAEDRVSRMRDEVRLAWEFHNGKPVLMGSVLIDERGMTENSCMRSQIFYREMPMALKALRWADRFLFCEDPCLDGAQVWIHFISCNPALDKSYDFGTIGSYMC